MHFQEERAYHPRSDWLRCMEVATHVRERLIEPEQRTLGFPADVQLLVKNLFQHRLLNVTQGRSTIVAFLPK